MSPTAAEIDAGQAIYTPWTLANYDWFVLGFSNPLLWHCPTAALRDLYDRNASAQHLDVGVGTGYFLDRATWPVAEPSLTLLDVNRHCLDAAARRLARFQPSVVPADILAPLPPIGPFASVGLCYLFHCLPGSIADKAVVFDHLAPSLAPGARVFGATILQGDAPRSGPAQALMNFYNRKGVFSNANDTAADLETAMRARYADVHITRIGAVALFEARARWSDKLAPVQFRNSPKVIGNHGARAI